MYIIKSWSKGGYTLYWSGTRYGWSILRERAYTYSTARGACAALMRNKGKHSGSSKPVHRPWTAAQVVPTIGDRF